MKKGAKKRLKSLFAAAALGIAGITSLFTTSACTPQNDTWKQLLKNNTLPFDTNSKTSETVKGPVFIQIESNLPSVHGLTLSPNADPTGISKRHGPAAAHIMNDAADKTAGKDVDVRYIEHSDHINNWIFNANSPIARAMFNNATIIGLSMGFLHSGDQGPAFSIGSIDTDKEIAEADDFWTSTKGILMLSAGNRGRDMKIGLERATALSTARADTLIKVGEAIKTEGGDVVVVPHSSRSGASFVTTQPYKEGQFYQYIKDEKSFREAMHKILETKANGYGDLTVRQVIREKLIVRLYVGHLSLEHAFYPMGLTLPRNISPAVVPPINSILDIQKLEFQGKDILFERDARWQADHPDEVIEAYINGLVSSLPTIRAQLGANENGSMTGMSGTSFSSPKAGGMLAGESIKHPGLSEYHLNAAALLASEPVGYVLRDDKNIEKISYDNNGRKIPFNSYEAGFGYLNETNLSKTAQGLTDLKKENKDLSVKELHLDTKILPVTLDKTETALPKFELNLNAPLIQLNSPLLDSPLDRPLSLLNLSGTLNQAAEQAKLPQTAFYKFEISEDIVALRTNIVIKFKNGASVAPEKITLISPSGGTVVVSPTKIFPNITINESGDFVLDTSSLSLASTDGFFGNYTKGTWTIKLPAECAIEGVRLTVHGFEKGGLVDTYIKNNIDHKPYQEPDYTPPKLPEAKSAGTASGKPADAGKNEEGNQAGQYAPFNTKEHMLMEKLAL